VPVFGTRCAYQPLDEAVSMMKPSYESVVPCGLESVLGNPLSSRNSTCALQAVAVASAGDSSYAGDRWPFVDVSAWTTSCSTSVAR